MKRILMTGGAGYVGSVLTPQLLAEGYEVTVFDIMYYGSKHLPTDHPKLKIVEGDIRDTAAFAQAVRGHDVVLHMAAISNDASFELDEKLSTTVNLDAFEPMVVAAKEAGVGRFIYASTSSVYGVSDTKEITEEHPLVPLTLYNDYKGKCEPLLFKHQADDFVCLTIRPATVCGYSPRQRLDVSVNILTNLAINNRKITVFGGSQMRPNIHIGDLCDLYRMVFEIAGDRIAGKTFNAGYQNMTIMNIARIVRKVVLEIFPDFEDIEIETTPTDDIRSYHINSDKIARELGFAPKRTVEEAVRDLCKAFKAGKLPDSLTDTIYFNVRRMKEMRAA